MSVFTQHFLKTLSQTQPKVADYLLPLGSSLSILAPFEVRSKDARGLTLFALRDIPTGENIVSIADHHTLSSKEIRGLSAPKAHSYEQYIEKGVKEYFPQLRKKELYNHYILLFQLLANLEDSSMPLYQYAKYLKKEKVAGSPLYFSEEEIKKIRSYSMVGSLKSIKGSIAGMSSYLEKRFIATAYQNLYDLIITIRNRSLRRDEHHLLCPLIDLAGRSFKPNCQLDQNYMVHSRTALTFLKSLRSIKAGQELTVDYGKLSNSQIYFRHGTYQPNNPHNYAVVRMDFEDDSEYMNQMFELKEYMFDKMGGLQEFIKINGKEVDSWGLITLRIFFLTTEDVLKNDRTLVEPPIYFASPVCNENELRVKTFLLKQLEMWEPHGKSELPVVETITRQENQIVKATIERLKNEITQLKAM